MIGSLTTGYRSERDATASGSLVGRPTPFAVSLGDGNSAWFGPLITCNALM